MAELLILAFDTFNSDENLDRFAWKLGHVIDVKPDGHVWGTLEGLPKFLKIKLPGIAVEMVTKFLDNKLDFTDPQNAVVTGIRKWKLGINDMPTAVKNALINTGEITITKTPQAAIDTYMKLV